MRIGSNASWRMYASIFFMRGTSFGVGGSARRRLRATGGAAP